MSTATGRHSTADLGDLPLEKRGSGQPPLWRRLARTTPFYIFVVDLVLALFFSLVSSHHTFATSENFQSLMRSTTEALILALALTVMLAAAVFDLSLGANLILSSVVGALTLRQLGAVNAGGVSHGHLGAVFVALAVCLVTGALFGLVNGLVITVLGVNSIIATLGTMGAGIGVALVVTNGSDVAGLPANMQTGFGLKTIGNVPLPMLVALGISAVLWAALRYTRFGMRTLAIGSNPTSAARAGLRVGRHLVRLTVIGGLLAGFAGFVDLSVYGQTALNGHQVDALNAATAVIIGGGALAGGRASVPGTIWGALLASILLDGLIVTGVVSFYQQIATGAVLIAAVSIDRFRSRLRTA